MEAVRAIVELTDASSPNVAIDPAVVRERRTKFDELLRVVDLLGLDVALEILLDKVKEREKDRGGSLSPWP